MKSPSKGFVSLLQAMDPALRVRFGSVIGEWVIERKSVIGETERMYLQKRYERLSKIVARPDPSSKIWQRSLSTFKGVAEELESAKGGHRVIVFAPELTTEVYNAICAADIKRYGGYSRYADELEKDEVKANEDVARIKSNKQNALHKEVYDMLNFVWRKKEDMLLNGERDLAKLLHGESQEGKDKPLITLEQM